MTRTSENRPILPLGHVLDEIIKNCRRQSDAEITKIRQIWKTLPSKNIAAYSRPTGLKNGILLVHVKSPALIHQLRFHSTHLIHHINGQMGKPAINGIKFKVGMF